MLSPSARLASTFPGHNQYCLFGAIATGSIFSGLFAGGIATYTGAAGWVIATVGGSVTGVVLVTCSGLYLTYHHCQQHIKEDNYDHLKFDT